MSSHVGHAGSESGAAAPAGLLQPFALAAIGYLLAAAIVDPVLAALGLPLDASAGVAVAAGVLFGVAGAGGVLLGTLFAGLATWSLGLGTVTVLAGVTATAATAALAWIAVGEPRDRSLAVVAGIALLAGVIGVSVRAWSAFLLGYSPFAVAVLSGGWTWLPGAVLVAPPLVAFARSRVPAVTRVLERRPGARLSLPGYAVALVLALGWLAGQTAFSLLQIWSQAIPVPVIQKQVSPTVADLYVVAFKEFPEVLLFVSGAVAFAAGVLVADRLVRVGFRE